MATQSPGDQLLPVSPVLSLTSPTLPGTFQLINCFLGNMSALLASEFAQNDLPAWNALFHLSHLTLIYS